MIGTLRGTIASKRPDFTVIEVNGVGYLVHVPLSTLSSLPDEGDTVFLQIHTHVREDSIDLYGFASEEEKRLFSSLINITGVGPKLALNILSGIPPDKFIEAIESENTGILSKIPGVGKKTANRLILELKEKLPSTTEKRDIVYEDVFSALINLGYKKGTAAEALERVYKNEGKSVETLLKETLKYLTNE